MLTNNPISYFEVHQSSRIASNCKLAARALTLIWEQFSNHLTFQSCGYTPIKQFPPRCSRVKQTYIYIIFYQVRYLLPIASPCHGG